MLKWVWTLIGLVFAVFVFAVFRWGIAPSPVSVIDPSEFSQPGKIGETAYEALWGDIAQQPVVILGGIADNEAAKQIALAFYQKAQHDHRFQQTYIEKEMPLGLTQAQHIDFNGQLDDIANKIKSLKKDQHIFIYTDNLYSTHLLAENPIRRLEASLKQKIFSLTMVGVALNSADFRKLDPACVGLSLDTAGTAKLGCVALAYSRGLARRHFDPARYLMALNQQGAKDYLMFLYSPHR